MIPHKYIVTLTNGTTQQEYKISATNEESAIILAQSEAIKLARGYELVSVRLIEDKEDKRVYCLNYRDGR